MTLSSLYETAKSSLTKEYKSELNRFGHRSEERFEGSTYIFMEGNYRETSER